MEQKKDNSRSEQRYNDVGPDRFAGTVLELYVTSNATTRWKGPPHLAYV